MATSSSVAGSKGNDDEDAEKNLNYMVKKKSVFK